MSRRRLAWIAATLVPLLAAGYGVLWLTAPPRHRISQHGFERIQIGMTEANVERILGGPPGDYTSGTAWDMFGPAGPDTKRWASEREVIYVMFKANVVADKRFLDVIFVSGNESFWNRLRRWLGITSDGGKPFIHFQF